MKLLWRSAQSERLKEDMTILLERGDAAPLHEIG